MTPTAPNELPARNPITASNIRVTVETIHLRQMMQENAVGFGIQGRAAEKNRPSV